MVCEEARAGIDRLNLAACLLLGHVLARIQREGAIKEMIDGDGRELHVGLFHFSNLLD